MTNSTKLRMYLQDAGFTGTQQGMTEFQAESLLRLLLKLNPLRLHHGDCIGADSQVHDLCIRAGILVETHPANIAGKRAFRKAYFEHLPKPPLTRNKDIVNWTDYLIAVPQQSNEIRRSGTWATIRYARKCGKKVYLILPNGEIK